MGDHEIDPLAAIDEAWARGEGRCSLCINMGDDEFQAMCDCSRAHFEATGKQLNIMVIGQPETLTPVFPTQPMLRRHWWHFIRYWRWHRRAGYCEHGYGRAPWSR